MIGEFKIIGKTSYLKMNKSGTLQKLPKLKWWWVVYFAFKQEFCGHVSLEEIRTRAVKSKRKP